MRRMRAIPRKIEEMNHICCEAFRQYGYEQRSYVPDSFEVDLDCQWLQPPWVCGDCGTAHPALPGVKIIGMLYYGGPTYALFAAIWLEGD